jgi:hypothetical protein
MSEENTQPNGWEKKTLVQRAISVGESKITATSILAMIDDKYKPKLEAAATPKEFAKQWGLLRTKVLTPSDAEPEVEPASEPEPTPEPEDEWRVAEPLDEQPEQSDPFQVAE